MLDPTSQENLINQASLDNTTNEFTVSRYPLKVGDGETQEYPHWVMFYITSRRSDVGAAEVVNNPTSRKITTDISNSNRPDKIEGDALENLARGLAVVGSAQILGGVGRSLARTFGAGRRVTRGFGTAGALAGAGAGLGIAKKILPVGSDQDRVVLNKAIALYVKDVPSSSYKADYDTSDIGPLGGLSGALDAISGAADGGGVTGALEGAKAALEQAGGAMGNLILRQNPRAFQGIGNITGLVSSSAGIAPNPFTAQIFKNVGFRKFNFSYVFLPKDYDEMIQVLDIIKTFKLYMHPTLKQENFILGYPGEFKIEYWHKDQRNKHLFQIGNCYLTDMEVKYGGQDFVTFKDTNGMPTEINMTLSFTEIELLTRNRIEEGY